jgi:hypothetical protein
MRIVLVAIAIALGVILAGPGQSQVNPGFNPNIAWCGVQGSVAIRGAANWQCLLPGTNGQALISGGPGANPSWVTQTGTGTVTSVQASGGTTGLSFSGGPITGAGTLTLGGALVLANGGISPVGSADTVLKSNGSAASWGSIVAANVTAGTLTNTEISASAGIALSKLASQPALTLAANITGGAAVPTSPTFTQALDAAFSSTQGAVLFRNLSGWSALLPGTNGQALLTGGAGGNPSWQTIQGGNLGTQPNNTVLANISGGSATPTTPTVSQLFDSALGSTQGQLAYRNGSAWTVLSPGTAGGLLQTNGAANNLAWTTPGQIVGTNTNDSATAGNIGEVISAKRLVGSALTMSSTVNVVLTSITLTAGDWDISGNCAFTPSNSGSITSMQCTIDTGTTINNDPETSGALGFFFTTAAANRSTVAIPPFRVSLSSGATYNLIGNMTAGANTGIGYGSLRARRMR